MMIRNGSSSDTIYANIKIFIFVRGEICSMFLINNKIYDVGEEINVLGSGEQLRIYGIQMEQSGKLMVILATHEAAPRITVPIDSIVTIENTPKLFLALEHKSGESLEYKGLRVGMEEREIQTQFPDADIDLTILEINKISDYQIFIKKEK